MLDLNKHKAKAYIPTPNGADTHCGGFVRYTPDWKGELLADMGGPKASMYALMRQHVPAARKAPPVPAPAAGPAAASNSVALGRAISRRREEEVCAGRVTAQKGEPSNLRDQSFE